ncbi:hypothetical protein MVEG_12413, partial [Podila verticillata NRRL 6337]
ETFSMGLSFIAMAYSMNSAILTSIFWCDMLLNIPNTMLFKYLLLSLIANICFGAIHISSVGNDDVPDDLADDVLAAAERELKTFGYGVAFGPDLQFDHQEHIIGRDEFGNRGIVGVVNVYWNPFRDFQGNVNAGLTADVMREAWQGLARFLRNVRDAIPLHALAVITTGADCPVADLAFEYVRHEHAIPMPMHPDKRTTNSRNPRNVTILPLSGIHGTSVKPDGTTRTNGKVNAGVSLCRKQIFANSRSGRCKNAATLLSGQSLRHPDALYSQIGSYLYIEKDGNLCLYSNGGTNYWCWNHGRKPKAGPGYLKLGEYGNLCMYDKKGEVYACSNKIGKPLMDYRLLMQNDGNLVVYDGNGTPIFATGSNIFPYNGPACKA